MNKGVFKKNIKELLLYDSKGNIKKDTTYRYYKQNIEIRNNYTKDTIFIDETYYDINGKKLAVNR